MMRQDHTIELKYAIQQLCSRVQMFRVKSPTEWNFRCPICGDSQKSKTKARGWIYQNQKGNFSYKCFNCGANQSVQQLLKENFIDLYEEYRLSIFKDRSHINNTPKKVFVPDSEFNFSLLKKSSESKEAKEFLSKRMIPEEKWNNFYYCEKLGSLIRQSRNDGRYDKIGDTGKFLVTPIYNWIDGTDKLVVQAICARNLDTESKLRYIHAKLRDDCLDNQVIFGLNQIDTTKTIIACEGIFDSVFIDNSIAMLTSVKVLKGYKESKVIYLIDNEPRNKDIVKIVKAHIENGRTVSLLPEKYLRYGKDINDYILAGLRKEEIYNDIINHSWSGPRAILEFELWKKI